MTMEVRGPDGIIVRFPDGTDDATIDRVMRQAWQERQAAQGSTVDRAAGGAVPAQADGQPEQPKRPDTGSFMNPFMDMLTLGAADEMAGGVRATVRAPFSDKTWQQIYDEEKARESANLENYWANHPGRAVGAGVAGAIAPAVLTRGRTLLPQGESLLARAGLGALSGAGQSAAYEFNSGEGGVQERAQGIDPTAVLTGAGVGYAMPGVAHAASSLYQGARALNPWRGGADRTNVAEEIAARTLLHDAGGDPALLAQRFSERVETPAQAGVPAVLADAGEKATSGLVRHATNVSPDAHRLVENFAQARKRTTGQRIGAGLEGLFGGQLNAVARRDALEAAARQQNRRNYAIAERQGTDLWDETLSRISAAPEVQDAIRMATRTGANEAAIAGQAPIRNPFRFVTLQDGSQRVVLERGVTPNLPFWDQVQRNLRSIEQSQAGTNAGRQAAELRRQLNAHLDQRVPEFRRARGVAAQFFGAQDALEAGQLFVQRNVDERQFADMIQQATPAEKELFAEGYADALRKIVRDNPDNASLLTKHYFRSETGRRKAVLALGQQRAGLMEAQLLLEDIFERLPQALGNSSTYRQMIAGGMVGGVAGYNADPGLGGLSSASVSGLVGAFLAHKARRVNSATMTRVAEMLLSNDPAIVQRGLRIVSRNEELLETIRNTHTALTRAAAAPAGQQVPQQ